MLPFDRASLLPALALALVHGHCAAGVETMGSCETSRPLETPRGELSKTECGNASTGYRHRLNFNGVPILSDTQLFRKDNDKTWSKWIYATGEVDPATGCHPRLYLLDLSMTPPLVLAFGVKGACNEFHWASWGDKRSVIALKHNVKFVYENGKLILPQEGSALWKTIEPPHAGQGLGEADAIPFVQEMPIPK